MNWLEELEKKLSERVSGLARDLAGAPREKSLIETCKDIQQEVQSKIVAQDRGLRSFPYTRLDIRVFAKDAGQRTAYDAVLNSGESLADRIRGMLTEEGCRVRDLIVEVTVAADAHQTVPYAIRYARPSKSSVKRTKSRPPAKLTVLRGQSEVSVFDIESDRVNIGRLREVVSAGGSIIRMNDIPFAESETTVAREHAFVKWDSAAARFLLYDSLSGARGTRVFRSGESIQLPHGPSKGVALQDGDEIHLGAARIRFQVSGE